MSRFVVAFAALGALFVGLNSAWAEVVVTVNKSTQRLTVSVNGVHRHEWPVSTARWGYHTPNGTYRPERLARKWYSRKYDNAPMPYSIFFHEGYAIHGSYEVRHLGRPASHGCIRLQPRNAAMLFKLVAANRGDTKIVVTGERPSRRTVARQTRREVSARRHRGRTVRRSYRERVVERRVERRYADFNDVFAPPPAYAYRGEPYKGWDHMLNRKNAGQRTLKKWWYSR